MSDNIKMYEKLKQCFFTVLLTLFCAGIFAVSVQAQSLIQTTSEEDEILALIHLNMLEVQTGMEENMRKAQLENVHTVVEIEIGNLRGSGVIFDITEEDILIVSNKHVLSGAEKGKVIFKDGFYAEGITEGLSENYDLGLMVVKWKDISIEQIRQIRKISISEKCYQKIERGEILFHIGSSDGVADSIYEGALRDAWWYMDDFDAYMMYNDCYAKPGMSGGGTYDAHGHYIGMVTGGNGYESASLPLVTVLKEYETLREVYLTGKF